MSDPGQLFLLGSETSPTLRKGSPQDPEQALGPALRGHSSFQNKFTVRNAREGEGKQRERDGRGGVFPKWSGFNSVRVPVALQQLTVSPWEFPRDLVVRTLAFSDVAWVPGLGSGLVGEQNPASLTVKPAKQNSETRHIRQEDTYGKDLERVQGEEQF